MVIPTFYIVKNDKLRKFFVHEIDVLLQSWYKFLRSLEQLKSKVTPYNIESQQWNIMFASWGSCRSNGWLRSLPLKGSRDWIPASTLSFEGLKICEQNLKWELEWEFEMAHTRVLVFLANWEDSTGRWRMISFAARSEKWGSGSTQNRSNGQMVWKPYCD